ncbi:uncharacterized protein LOC132275469 [Cornus florida]|uniref:uncharacterized protein LOC132275469 n=1 Tax=Cornus florida TaxID=4283 RepID=UPI002897F200|nr:uncharacterized protein LOC132275469 [Cornus florida]
MSMMTIVKNPSLLLIQGPNHFTARRSIQNHNKHVHVHAHVLTSPPKKYLYGIGSSTWLSSPCNTPGRGVRCLSNRISAVGSGLEASITDPKDNAITVKDAKIVVESQDDDKIQIRVDVTGKETQKVFDKVLANLARTAPPIPGFRREKGGKTSKVPKSFLLQVIGEERVTKFVIQEIVSSTMADYVKKENLNVKDKKINTTQTAEELKLLFAPGNEFGFNAILELEKIETETTSSSTPEI